MRTPEIKAENNAKSIENIDNNKCNNSNENINGDRRFMENYGQDRLNLLDKMCRMPDTIHTGYIVISYKVGDRELHLGIELWEG